MNRTMAAAPLFQALRLAYNDDIPDGYWGEKTSTLNFCEEGHPRIFLIAYMGYIVVGLGSTAFHTSLKYPMQLIDELSMIYTTLFMVFATFAYSKSNRFSVFLGSGLVLLAGFITSYYHITKDPVFHQGCYAALTTTVVLRSLYVMETQLRPVLTKRNGGTASRTLNTMWIMVGTGLGVFLTGFLIWNLDNAFCSQIRRLRRHVGLPWGALLEGHAWWHLMTGLAYYYITWGIWLRRCLEGREDEYRLVWPRSLSSIPVVVKAKKSD
ncbi:alkaline phytoceramidase [Colletotrichum karsti]|uniref:Alkaline phytoceramidase n=1 Tax=Colletotrichum karsti TaxID=1095194 RepID=A0A9P6HTS7_9PEZI|nr:alkaline phytoceramidase [Colletotrichum karsti]KAF9869825.1 alkaline phytoceramidase [Colletotrichum karsti]